MVQLQDIIQPKPKLSFKMPTETPVKTEVFAENSISAGPSVDVMPNLILKTKLDSTVSSAHKQESVFSRQDLGSLIVNKNHSITDRIMHDR